MKRNKIETKTHTEKIEPKKNDKNKKKELTKKEKAYLG